MRKVMSMVICTALVLCITVTPAFASSENDEIVVESKSEYEYITELQGCSEEELSELGYSDEEIAELYAFSFEEALCERAQLPEAQLRGMGYNDAEIALLKQSVSDSERLTRAAATLSATCTGYLSVISASPTYVKFRYTWEWNFCPFFLFQDRAAVGFVGVSDDGSFKAVNGIQGSSACVLTKTFVGQNGATSTWTEVCEDFTVEPFGATCVYDMGTSVSGYTLWVSGGYMDVMVNRVGNYTLDCLYVEGKVAHNRVILTAPSVTFTFGTENGVAVEFSASVSIDEVGGVKKFVGGTYVRDAIIAKRSR